MILRKRSGGSLAKEGPIHCGSASAFPSRETPVTFVLSRSRFSLTPFTVHTISKLEDSPLHDGFELDH